MTNYYAQGRAFEHSDITLALTDTGFLRKIFGAIFEEQKELFLKKFPTYVSILEDIGREKKAEQLEHDASLYRPNFKANFKLSVEKERKTFSSDPLGIWDPLSPSDSLSPSDPSSSISPLSLISPSSSSVPLNSLDSADPFIHTSIQDIELVALEFNGLWVEFSRPITKQIYDSKSEDFFDNWAPTYTPKFRPSYLTLLTESKQSIYSQNERILLQDGGNAHQTALKFTKTRTNLAFVKKLCSDYSSCLTNFFCFHWNRHNQASARQIIRDIEFNQAAYEKKPLELAKYIAWIIAELEPTLNKEGSFKRRMDLAIAQLTDGQYLHAEAVLKDFPHVLKSDASPKAAITHEASYPSLAPKGSTHNL